MNRPNVLGIIEIIDTTLYFKVYNSQSKIANGLVHEWDCLHWRNHKKTEILKVECGECSMVFCVEFEMVFTVDEMRACYEWRKWSMTKFN